LNNRAIEAHGLVKRFGKVTAVDGLDLELDRGRCLGLLGPNGAGKTTAVSMLVGLLRPDAGEMAVLGRRWADDGSGIRELIGVQLQETALTDKLTVRELLRVFRSFYREGRTLDEVIALVGLEEKADAQYRTLSGGQRQRLMIARAIVNKPKILFLDEATSALDNRSQAIVTESMDKMEATRIVIAHRLSTIINADKICYMDGGKIIEMGNYDELMKMDGLFAALAKRQVA